MFLPLLASIALADIAPPPDYVETCTVENQQAEGRTCEACADAYHGDVEACAKKFEGKGLTRACRTAGASVWTEVWCDGPANPAQGQTEPPPAPPKKGCDVTGASAGGLGLVLLAGLAALGLRRRAAR